MLVPLPQKQLKRLVLCGGIRMLIQISLKVKLLMITAMPQMNMKDTLGKAIFGIALIQVDPTRCGIHADIAMSNETAAGGLQICSFRQLRQNIDDRLCPNTADSSAADMVDDSIARQQRA